MASRTQLQNEVMEHAEQQINELDHKRIQESKGEDLPADEVKQKIKKLKREINVMVQICDRLVTDGHSIPELILNEDK
jgi:hypothetical protein